MIKSYPPTLSWGDADGVEVSADVGGYAYDKEHKSGWKRSIEATVEVYFELFLCSQ